jgi:hypothetical protein
MSHFITKRQFIHKWPRPKKIGQENARILGDLNGRRNPGKTRSNKIGLYRDRMKQPMTIYFDNYALGDSYETVDPARFESNLKAAQNH